MLVNDVKELVRYSYDNFKNDNFIFTKKEENFIAKTRGKTIIDIWSLANKLLELGYEGEKIVLIGENSYEWAITYMAIIGYVGIAVLVDKEYTKYDFDNIFNVVDDVSLVIYSESKNELIQNIKQEHNTIKYMSLQNDIMKLIQNDKIYNDNIFKTIDNDKMCEIVFTSGTTSKPKAIMLSQKNILVNMESLFKRTPMNREDSVLLVLPLHHLYAGVHAYLYSYYSGLNIYISNNIKEIVQDFSLVKPTAFLGVPIIFEKILDSIGKQNASMLKQVLGGRLKYIYCGGATFNPETKKAYYDNGLDILDAYGVSEMSSVISFAYMGEEFNLSQRNSI